MKKEQFTGLKADYQAAADVETAERSKLAKMTEKKEALSAELDTLHDELATAKAASSDAMEKYVADAMDKEKLAKVRRAEAALGERLSDTAGIIASLEEQVENQRQVVAAAKEEARVAASHYWNAVRAEMESEFRQMATPHLERLATLRRAAGAGGRSFVEVGAPLFGNRRLDQRQFESTKDELAAEHGVPIR